MPVSKKRKIKSAPKKKQISAGRTNGFRTGINGIDTIKYVLNRAKEVYEELVPRDPTVMPEPWGSKLTRMRERLPSEIERMEKVISEIRTELKRVEKFPNQRESYYDKTVDMVENAMAVNNATVLPMIADWDTLMEIYADAVERVNSQLVN